jgi:hypothetical protein
LLLPAGTASITSTASGVITLGTIVMAGTAIATGVILSTGAITLGNIISVTPGMFSAGNPGLANLLGWNILHGSSRRRRTGDVRFAPSAFNQPGSAVRLRGTVGFGIGSMIYSSAGAVTLGTVSVTGTAGSLSLTVGAGSLTLGSLVPLGPALDTSFSSGSIALPGFSITSAAAGSIVGRGPIVLSPLIVVDVTIVTATPISQFLVDPDLATRILERT